MLRTIKERFKQLLVAGILTLVPLSFTVWFILWVVDFLDHLFLALIPLRYQKHLLDIANELPGLGMAATLVVVLLFGLIARTVLGGWFLRCSERCVRSMPVIGAVFSTAKNLFAALFVPKEHKQRVALVEYPSEGSWCFCFVTGRVPASVAQTMKDKKTYVTVFVPTAPNPTSGILLVTREDRLRYVDMSSEQGMRYVISAGMLQEEEGDQKECVKDTP